MTARPYDYIDFDQWFKDCFKDAFSTIEGEYTINGIVNTLSEQMLGDLRESADLSTFLNHFSDEAEEEFERIRFASAKPDDYEIYDPSDISFEPEALVESLLCRKLYQTLTTSKILQMEEARQGYCTLSDMKKVGVLDELGLSPLEDPRRRFSIYQLKFCDDNRMYAFASLDVLEKLGMKVDPDRYEKVYEAPLSPNDDLESIYVRFNLNRPCDFRGHSMSVSDIVVLQSPDEDGEMLRNAYYCDSFGFKPVPQFLCNGNERHAAFAYDGGYLYLSEADRGFIGDFFDGWIGRFFDEMFDFKGNVYVESESLAEAAVKLVGEDRLRGRINADHVLRRAAIREKEKAHERLIADGVMESKTRTRLSRTM